MKIRQILVKVLSASTTIRTTTQSVARTTANPSTLTTTIPFITPKSVNYSSGFGPVKNQLTCGACYGQWIKIDF